MRNIVIDIGNSYTKLGIFEDHKLIEVIEQQSFEEVFKFANSTQADNFAISAVSNFDQSLIKNRNPLILNNKTPVPIINDYKTPHTLGMDRLAAAVGSKSLYPDDNCLVIDMGTCITYDYINKAKEYKGGAISPGLKMRLKSLHNFTSALPLVEWQGEQVSLVGNSTMESILSGVVNGIKAEIEQTIEMYQNKFGDVKIIICGGAIKVFETNLKAPIFAVPELVLIGLNTILLHNVEHKN